MKTGERVFVTAAATACFCILAGIAFWKIDWTQFPGGLVVLLPAGLLYWIAVHNVAVRP